VPSALQGLLALWVQSTPKSAMQDATLLGVHQSVLGVSLVNILPTKGVINALNAPLASFRTMRAVCAVNLVPQIHLATALGTQRLHNVVRVSLHMLNIRPLMVLLETTMKLLRVYANQSSTKIQPQLKQSMALGKTNAYLVQMEQSARGQEQRFKR